MSGGTFDYNQRRIRYIADDIEQEIAKSGKPEDLNHYKYPDEVIAEFKNAYEMLRKAEIYAQRVDCLLAGDDGDQSFLERLKSDLELLKSELAIKTFEAEEDEDED